jgi:hypothetical protein
MIQAKLSMSCRVLADCSTHWDIAAILAIVLLLLLSFVLPLGCRLNLRRAIGSERMG